MNGFLAVGLILAATPGPPLTPAEADANGSHLNVGCHTLTGEAPVHCSPHASRPTNGRRIGRVALELGLGGLFGGAAFATGALATVNDSDSPVQYVGAGTSSVLAGAGVLLAGYALQGDGSVWWTMGTATAVGALTTTFFTIQGTTNGDYFGLSIGLMALPLVCSIVAYELTSSTDRRFKEAPAVQVVPAISPTRDMSGGTVGVAGLF